nr:uncharacterized protein K02A2.6-like [Solanum lycopersicum]
MFFDGAVNSRGSGIGAVLISESGQHFPATTKLRFRCTNNMVEYEACILGIRMALDMNIQELLIIGDSDLLIHQVQGEWAVKNPKILPYVQLVRRLCKRFRKTEFRHTSRIQNEFADALVTISSMIQHRQKSYIDPLEIGLKEQPAHCLHVEKESDVNPWYIDVKRRTPNTGLLRCVDAVEATKLLEEVHAGVCGTHMNGFTLANKILRAGFFWMTMENDCVRFVQRFHKCQVHGDLIKVPPHELYVMSSFWPFAVWGMDVIGPIEPAASNGHRFSFVAIDYFTKWVEVASYKAVTKKVVTDFVRNNLICRFGVPESLITDNGANLNIHFMKEICEQFKITHHNSTSYRPQMNGAVEAANKNIKRILRKMIDNYKCWHENLPYALLGYRTTIRTSTGATLYLLVYGTEEVIPAEVKIPSLRIIQEAGLSDAE